MFDRVQLHLVLVQFLHDREVQGVVKAHDGCPGNQHDVLLFLNHSTVYFDIPNSPDQPLERGDGCYLHPWGLDLCRRGPFHEQLDGRLLLEQQVDFVQKRRDLILFALLLNCL